MTATWMIRLCDKTRSAGGRCGHGRGWPLAGRASRRVARSARAGVLPGQVAPGGVRLPWGATGGGRGAPVVLATGRGRRARYAAAMQALLAEHRWDWKAALRALQRF